MRIGFFVILLIVFLLIPPNFKASQASSNGILLRDYKSLTFYIGSKNITSFQLLENIVILPETSFNESEAIAMITRIGKIHPSILKALISKNIQIKLFNGLLTDEPTAAHLKGLKPRGYSENAPTWDYVPGIGGAELVLAKIGHSQKGMGHGSVNLELHELAHSIDRFVLGSIRQDPIFLNIWKKESSTLFQDREYFVAYPEEYFAEAFVYFYFSAETKEILETKAPITYELFNKLEKAEFYSSKNSVFHH